MRLTVTTFVTLDGVMQAPGGPQEDPSGGFTEGGWLVPFMDPRAGELVSEQFSTADAFLLGRGTYEIFAGYWPQVSDPDDVVARALNGLPKYVASSTLQAADWAGTTIISGDVVTRVQELRGRPGRDLQVHGSHGLLQTLNRAGLVDEYRVWVFPVVLGTGKRLFEHGTAPTALELAGTEVTSTGVAVHTYRPAGVPRHGEFTVSDDGTSTPATTPR